MLTLSVLDAREPQFGVQPIRCRALASSFRTHKLAVAPGSPTESIRFEWVIRIVCSCFFILFFSAAASSCTAPFRVNSARSIRRAWARGYAVKSLPIKCSWLTPVIGRRGVMALLPHRARRWSGRLKSIRNPPSQTPHQNLSSHTHWQERKDFKERAG
jgi:hypothetical protein